MNATRIIDAKELKISVKDEIENTVAASKIMSNVKRGPKLVIITATDDKLLHKEIDRKIEIAKEFNIDIVKLEFDNSITTEELELNIEKLNEDELIDGISLQTPMYNHLEEDYLLNIIDFDKDVEGLTLMSKAFLENDELNYMPPTSAGIIFLLESVGIRESDIEGKNVVVIGRSKKAGSPISITFKHLNANVVMLHSKTKEKDLKSYIENADIVISCVGKRFLLRADWIKEDALVIGVGYSYDESNNKHLDIELNKVIEFGRASFITDVNTINEATTFALLYNTTLAYCRKL